MSLNEATIEEPLTLKEDTTVEDGTVVAVTIKLKGNMTLAIHKDEAKVDGSKVSYPFTIKDLAERYDVETSKIKKVVGGIDINHDALISKHEETEVKVVKEKTEFIGLIHNPEINAVHLITKKDIEKYKLDKVNPVTKALENQHPMIQGAGSIFAGLYNFGNWAVRIGGFNNYSFNNIKFDEQKEASQELKYTGLMIKHIILNTGGAGEIFTESAKKYIKENPEYVIGRFLTGMGLSKAVTLKKSATGITIPSIVGDVTFKAEQIDDFAKSIILGDRIE